MDEIIRFPKTKEEKPKTKMFDKKISFKFKTLMQIIVILIQIVIVQILQHKQHVIQTQVVIMILDPVLTDSIIVTISPHKWHVN